MAEAQRELKIRIRADGSQAERDAEKSADKVRESWADALGNVRNLILGLGAAFGAAAAHVVDMATQIDRGAQGLGVSAQQFQRLQYAAQAAGLETNDLGESMGALAQKAQDAASGGGAADLFRRMGISATDAAGNVRSANDLFLEAADSLAAMGPGTEQTAAALQLFGEKGRRLLPVLGQGRAGVQALFDEFDALGGGLSDETIGATRDFNREMLRAKTAMMSAIGPLVTALLPYLRSFAEVLVDGARGLSRLASNSHLMRAGLLALTGIVAGLSVAFGVLASESLIAMAPIYGTILLIAGGMAIAGLALDDLITTFEGGDSIIRRFVDSIFGVGATANVVRAVQSEFLRLEAILYAMQAAFDSVFASALEALQTFVIGAVSTLGSLLPSDIANSLASGAVSMGQAAVGLRGSAAQSTATGQGLLGASAAIAGGGAALPVPAAVPGAGGPRNVNANTQVRVQVSGVVTEEGLAQHMERTLAQTLTGVARTTAAELAQTGGRR